MMNIIIAVVGCVLGLVVCSVCVLWCYELTLPPEQRGRLRSCCGCGHQVKMNEALGLPLSI